MKMEHANLTDQAVARAKDANEALSGTVGATPQEKFLQGIGYALTSIAFSLAAAQAKKLD